MVLHGFTRPGYGYTIGQCPGAGEEPFEYSHAFTDQRVIMLKEEIKKAADTIAKIDSGKVSKVPNPNYLTPEELEKKQKSRFYRANPEYEIEFITRDHDNFEWVLKRLRANTASRMNYDQRTLVEFETLISGWKLGKIVGIDSPATGKIREIADAYDPDKAKAREEYIAAKAARAAKPGKISVLLFTSYDDPDRGQFTDDEHRAYYTKQHELDDAFKLAVRGWAKSAFSGKVWVGDCYSGDIERVFPNARQRRIRAVTMRVEWQHLDDLEAMFPEGQFVVRRDENAKKVQMVVSSEAFPETLRSVVKDFFK